MSEAMDTPDEVRHETVMDTAAEQLGKTYAQALLGAASKAGITEKIVDQLNELFDQALGGSESLAAVFASPRVDEDEKCRVIDRLFGETYDPLLLRFLKVLAGRGRLGQLAAVRDGVVSLFDEMSGQVLAKVSTAVPLEEGLRESIAQRLGDTLGKKVRLQETVDQSLIGGMVVRVGDTVFDNSVSGRLNAVAKRARDGFSSKLSERFDQLTR
ncbi:MAG: ATP synthase F1 subunit delta [Planctomycetota bacterium]